MRITINLASRPYVELGSVLRKLRIAMIALAVVALGMGIWTITLDQQDKKLQARIHAVELQTAKLQSERTANEARMKLPMNAAELARSQFLNDLFARKSFSWTAVLMDLETVLPAGLQVSSIEPQVHAGGEVYIRLRVGGNRDRAVDLLRNLEKSKRFIAPRLIGESSEQTKDHGPQNPAVPVGDPNMVQFDILSGYNPLQDRRHEKAAANDEKKNAEAKAVNADIPPSGKKGGKR